MVDKSKREREIPNRILQEGVKDKLPKGSPEASRWIGSSKYYLMTEETAAKVART